MKTKKKILILKNKDTIKELKEEVKKTNDEKYKTRLKAIILLKKKQKLHEVSDSLVVSMRSISRWVKIYNKSGKKGLKTKKAGRPKGKKKWDDKIFKKLTKEINKADRYWSVRLMTDWMKKNEEVEIPESTMWYKITQLGYSNKSSRPYPYKGDKEKQKEFKKGASRPPYRIISRKTMLK